MSGPSITIRRAVPDDIPMILTFPRKKAGFDDPVHHQACARRIETDSLLFRVVSRHHRNASFFGIFGGVEKPALKPEHDENKVFKCAEGRTTRGRF